MDNTIYESLSTSRSEIRLLEILTLEAGQPIECCLHTVSLDDNPTFSALSYVWGDVSITRNIIVNGHTKAVTKNLESALRHVQPHWERFGPNRDFRLWADAVCINQDNIVERTSQVRLMGFIYRKCRLAFVWLGQGNRHTKDAFEWAHYIHEHVPPRQHTPPSGLFESAPVLGAKLRHSMGYVTQLTFLPWFERAWTFQEAILPSTVLLVCGNYSIPLEFLEPCCEVAHMHTGAFTSGPAHLLFATRAMEDGFNLDLGRLPPDDLERLLSFRRGAKASDPRDVIFSLLGLFAPSVSEKLQPDYSISVKDLFVAATKHIILESGELRILCSVESPKHLEDEALPSWVPDWRASPETCRNVLHARNPRSGYLATKGSVLCCDPSPNVHELHVYGIRIGAVNQAGKFNDTHSINQFNLPERYIHTNQPIRTALRQAQTLDQDIAYETIPASHPKRKSLATFLDLPTGSRSQSQKCTQCPVAHIMPIISMNEGQGDPFWEHFGNIVERCNMNVSSRSFFTTNSRYLGFGPESTATEDQVFLLLGSDIPFVIRPAGKEFELVGACYVHGIMYGEGVHPDLGFDSRFYPGSVPGGEWDFSNPKVYPATWTTVAANDNETRSGVRRFLLYEEEGEPVLVEAEEIILR